MVVILLEEDIFSVKKWASFQMALIAVTHHENSRWEYAGMDVIIKLTKWRWDEGKNYVPMNF